MYSALAITAGDTGIDLGMREPQGMCGERSDDRACRCLRVKRTKLAASDAVIDDALERPNELLECFGRVEHGELRKAWHLADHQSDDDNELGLLHRRPIPSRERPHAVGSRGLLSLNGGVGARAQAADQCGTNDIAKNIFLRGVDTQQRGRRYARLHCDVVERGVRIPMLAERCEGRRDDLVDLFIVLELWVGREPEG